MMSDNDIITASLVVAEHVQLIKGKVFYISFEKTNTIWSFSFFSAAKCPLRKCNLSPYCSEFSKEPTWY